MRGDTQSFIVRIWHEVIDKEGRIVVWRGSIDHVGSDKRMYFNDLGAVARFIQERIGLPAKPDSCWKSLLARIRRGSN